MLAALDHVSDQQLRLVYLLLVTRYHRAQAS
jgi:hypothetical protein